MIVATSGGFSMSFTLSSHFTAPQNIKFVNGANFQIQTGCQPPGCFAPGEVVTVTGSGFATGVAGVVSGLTILGPLQTSLAGMSITFNGVLAPIFYVANVNGVESMTIQVPFETQPGSVTVVLTRRTAERRPLPLKRSSTLQVSSPAPTAIRRSR